MLSAERDTPVLFRAKRTDEVDDRVARPRLGVGSNGSQP
jgi:hypothetical protein